MTDKSISAQTKTGSHKTATPHAQTYSWQVARLKGSGCRSFTTLQTLLALAEKVGRGLKPSDPWYSPSIETLVDLLEADERSIRRSIALLARLGIIHVQRDHHGRNLYRLATSPEEADNWQAAETLTPRNRHAQSQHQRTSQSNISGQVSPASADIAVPSSGHPCPVPADIAVPTSGHPCPVERDEAPSTSALIVDTCDEKPTEKTAPIRQYEQTSELTKETDNNKQGPTMFYPPILQSSAAAVVVVQNLSMSQETEPTAEPMDDDHNLLFGETKGSLKTCIRQFGDAQPIGSNFGDDCEYQYWPEYENPKTLEAFTAEQVLGHYKLNAKLPHIAKALKEAQGQGIPTIELVAAIVWKLRNISPTQDGGLAWNMLDRNLAETWGQWQQHTTAKLERAASKQRERKDKQQRRAQQEHQILERMARSMEQDAENERLYFVAKQERCRKLEHDARPENVLERTLLEVASLVQDLEQLNAKNCACLAERATQNEKQEAELVAHSKSAHWQANPKAFEDFKKTLQTRSTKSRATEDAEYRVAVDIINSKLAQARGLAEQLRQALAEAA